MEPASDEKAYSRHFSENPPDKERTSERDDQCVEVPEQVVAVHLHIDQEHENAVEKEKIRKARTDDQPAEIQFWEVIFQYPLLGIMGCDAHFFE